MSYMPDLKVQSKKIRDLAMYDLRRFLYARPYSKNGKALDSRWFFRMIDSSEAGPAKVERLGLILAIKEELEARLESGGAIPSLDSSLAVIQLFFDFAHNEGAGVTLGNAEEIYLDYCEHLFHRSHGASPDLKLATAYGYGSTLSKLFGDILDIPKPIELMGRTRLTYPIVTKKAVGRQSDKQNLDDTYKMGSFLVDIMAGITVEAIYGELPIEIPIRNSLVKNDALTLSLNSFRSSLEAHLLTPLAELTSIQRKKMHQVRKARGPVETIQGTKRHYFVSLRVSAEFLVFLAQTGMNSAQARKLPRAHFKYKPVGDSWEVRCYKGRRQGEVYFKVYKSYKPYMHEYIKFIDHFFPDSELLFPWLDKGASLSKSREFRFQSLSRLLKAHHIPWVSPRYLRNTRVNWCLRRSGGDAGLASEIHQHLRETLRDKYERPSQQRSMTEITYFWSDNDPIKRGELKASLISSHCNGNPIETEDKPRSVVPPNCSNQSGCLWCRNLRDIDSFDYVWSLASFRHLKTLEAAGVHTKEEIPADLVIARLTEKIRWYRTSTKKRMTWAEEAEMRISEGDYHPTWSGILGFLE